MKKLINKFILWAIRTKPYVKNKSNIWYHQQIIGRHGKTSIRRFMPFWEDESKYLRVKDGNVIINKPMPWYRFFNINLHWWYQDDGETFHDHPRWSITIVLRGQLIEETPWKTKILNPGSIVIRSYRSIHRFKMDSRYKGKTWTLFIVGKWKHSQNEYLITNLYED